MQTSDSGDWVLNNYLHTSSRFDHREYRMEFSMRAVRSSENVTKVPVQTKLKKNSGSKSLPFTNLYVKYVREKFYFVNSSLDSVFCVPLVLTSRRKRKNEKKVCNNAKKSCC